MEDTKIQVESFYEFWYNFDSWRSYEYNDKEVNEGADRYENFIIIFKRAHSDEIFSYSRDDKRYAEKKNKADRAKAKKDDITRVRELVDKALSTDPRIKKFKAEEKAAREAKRNKGKPGGVGSGMTKAQLEAKKKEEEAKAKEELAKKEAEDKVRISLHPLLIRICSEVNSYRSKGMRIKR